MENYNSKMREVIKSLSGKPRLLLHSCCAPCSSSVILTLRDAFEITVYYYNPNIMPEEEYYKRLDEQRKLCKLLDIPLIEGEYSINKFLATVKGREHDLEGAERCSLCFELRLSETARLAEKDGYDFFCTTLTVSPHKNAAVINEIGNLTGARYNVPFLPSDFKKEDGYKRSIELSKQYELYRQNYCGCKLS